MTLNISQHFYYKLMLSSKNVSWFTKKIKWHKKRSTLKQHIRIISDTEDWSNDAENTALIPGINNILTYSHRKHLFQKLIFHNITCQVKSYQIIWTISSNRLKYYKIYKIQNFIIPAVSDENNCLATPSSSSSPPPRPDKKSEVAVLRMLN